MNQSEQPQFFFPSQLDAASLANFRALVAKYAPGSSAMVDKIVAGTNVTISPSGGTGNVTVNAAGAVTSLAAGTGITLSSSTGAITVTNSGVTSLTAGAGITVSASTGAVTIGAAAAAVYLAGSGGGTYTTASNTISAVDATNLQATLTGYPSNSPLLVTFSGEVQMTATASPILRVQDTANGLTALPVVSAPLGTGSTLAFYAQGVYVCPAFPATLRLEWALGTPGGSTAAILNSGSAPSSFGFSANSGASPFALNVGSIPQVAIIPI
jgi:hypothetical protein